MIRSMSRMVSLSVRLRTEFSAILLSTLGSLIAIQSFSFASLLRMVVLEL